MNAEVLKNAEAWLHWKECHIFDGDIAAEPTRYPCWARTAVRFWNMEREEAVYMYREDFQKLLEQM